MLDNKHISISVTEASEQKRVSIGTPKANDDDSTHFQTPQIPLADVRTAALHTPACLQTVTKTIVQTPMTTTEESGPMGLFTGYRLVENCVLKLIVFSLSPRQLN